MQLYLAGQEAVVKFEPQPARLQTSCTCTCCIILLFSTGEKGSPRRAWGREALTTAHPISQLGNGPVQSPWAGTVD